MVMLPGVERLLEFGEKVKVAEGDVSLEEEVRAEMARRRALGPFVVGWWKATLRNKTGVARETEKRPAI